MLCRHAFLAQRLLINEACSRVGTTMKKGCPEALELCANGLDSKTVTAAIRDLCSDNRSSVFAHHWSRPNRIPCDNTQLIPGDQPVVTDFPCPVKGTQPVCS